MKVRLAVTLAARLVGLSNREGFDGILLLAPCNDIHTYTMKDPIDVAFVSRDGIVLESHRNVATRKRLRCRRAVAVLERFSCDAPWCEPGAPVRIFPEA